MSAAGKGRNPGKGRHLFIERTGPSGNLEPSGDWPLLDRDAGRRVGVAMSLCLALGDRLWDSDENASSNGDKSVDTVVHYGVTYDAMQA